MILNIRLACQHAIQTAEACAVLRTNTAANEHGRRVAGESQISHQDCVPHSLQVVTCYTPLSGCAHVSKALENNTSITLLDMSGNSVCSSTCVVLVETLLVNKTLTHLVLQDNPLGRSGARKLLRAVHEGDGKDRIMHSCLLMHAVALHMCKYVVHHMSDVYKTKILDC